MHQPQHGRGVQLLYILKNQIGADCSLGHLTGSSNPKTLGIGLDTPTPPQPCTKTQFTIVVWLSVPTNLLG
ncbi:hypothetical protein GCM10007939_09940 [Amylibacter marinus]|uniref:Uncharacterized protein n=1 Tax=Amylibacter marinus TaxID=1475483 RepID=A0ABQ5VTK8_9RHOB|nr:hypothetical protein GCM10007939_09940 [Amylibacter marinus]